MAKSMENRAGEPIEDKVSRWLAILNGGGNLFDKAKAANELVKLYHGGQIDDMAKKLILQHRGVIDMLLHLDASRHSDGFSIFLSDCANYSDLNHWEQD